MFKGTEEKVTKDIVDLMKAHVESQLGQPIPTREMKTEPLSDRSKVVFDLVEDRIKSGLPLKKWFSEVKK